MELEIIVRLMLAVVIGGAVGYEREYQNRPAGFRTHILVCVGAAVIAMLETSLQSSMKIDIGRLTAQVISGIGFLGAGTIIRENGSVKGLTTAASLWIVACIGLCAGFVLYYLSVSATIVVFGVLVSLKRFENKFFDKVKVLQIDVTYSDKNIALQNLTAYFTANSIKIKNIEFYVEDGEENCDEQSAHFTVLVPRYLDIFTIIREISLIKGVLKVIKD